MNFKLETETWFDQKPSHQPVPALLVKARKIEAQAKRHIDEYWDEAERTGVNPLDELTGVSEEHFRAIDLLNTVTEYYNGAGECGCVTDEQSCRFCKALAAVANFELEDN